MVEFNVTAIVDANNCVFYVLEIIFGSVVISGMSTASYVVLADRQLWIVGLVKPQSLPALHPASAKQLHALFCGTE